MIKTVAIFAGLFYSTLVQASGDNPYGPNFMEEVTRSLCTVHAFDEKGKPTGQGSCFVVGRGNLVATSAHVLEGSATMKVVFADGIQTRAVGLAKAKIFSKPDLALIPIRKTREPILPCTKGISPGTEIAVLGNPLGLGIGISKGVISRYDPHGNPAYYRFDAAISPGNSGGPIISSHNEYGILDYCVVGMVTGTIKHPKAQNINYAISSKHLLFKLLEREPWGIAGGQEVDVKPTVSGAPAIGPFTVGEPSPCKDLSNHSKYDLKWVRKSKRFEAEGGEICFGRFLLQSIPIEIWADIRGGRVHQLEINQRSNFSIGFSHFEALWDQTGFKPGFGKREEAPCYPHTASPEVPKNILAHHKLMIRTLGLLEKQAQYMGLTTKKREEGDLSFTAGDPISAASKCRWNTAPPYFSCWFTVKGKAFTTALMWVRSDTGSANGAYFCPRGVTHKACREFSSDWTSVPHLSFALQYTHSIACRYLTPFSDFVCTDPALFKMRKQSGYWENPNYWQRVRNESRCHLGLEKWLTSTCRGYEQELKWFLESLEYHRENLR